MLQGLDDASKELATKIDPNSAATQAIATDDPSVATESVPQGEQLATSLNDSLQLEDSNPSSKRHKLEAEDRRSHEIHPLIRVLK